MRSAWVIALTLAGATTSVVASSNDYAWVHGVNYVPSTERADADQLAQQAREAPEAEGVRQQCPDGLDDDEH